LSNDILYGILSLYEFRGKIVGTNVLIVCWKVVSRKTKRTYPVLVHKLYLAERIEHGFAGIGFASHGLCVELKVCGFERGVHAAKRHD
jgi:hypothetical protein